MNMDNYSYEKESCEKRNSNTEYVPTKCRVTRPPPPKPATNPLQFVKVAPPPLFKKAQEQIKKVEEIKKERKEIRDETEDWQQNLDNWKSCRRKRQEHIIERVVEVKKLTEQEELEKAKRKSKTFSEMLEERSQKGRPKVSLHIYTDDDSNDLSDYGIGSSARSNSVKDFDTDSSSVQDEKDNQAVASSPFPDISSPEPSQSEDDAFSSTKKPTRYPEIKAKPTNHLVEPTFNDNVLQQYTYEGAIEDYRSRIQNKIKLDDSLFSKREVVKSKEFSEAQAVLPKGEISKRKGLFEPTRSMEVSHLDNPSSRRLSEDFVNARSLKDRLKSLESATDQSLAKVEASEIQVSVKERLANFNRQQEPDRKATTPTAPPKISSYLLEKSNSAPRFDWKPTERCSSPETEMYMNKLTMFSHDLNNLMGGKDEYPAFSSSMELATVLSDREDSGIHTADVSCSVSQADEPIDTENDTIPSCIEKLKQTEEMKNEDVTHDDQPEQQSFKPLLREDIIDFTKEFLDSLIKTATEEIASQHQSVSTNVPTETSTPKPNNNFIEPDFDFPVKALEPPKERPPPPPVEERTPPERPVRRMNSTKRIIKEIHSKRSSFLGIDDPNTDLLDPDLIIEKPPDISTFLQKEQKMEKSLYKKIQEESRTGLLSKVESQDSGLDIDRGRLSSDTWCSSVPSHDRQDSEHTNSVTSEEDEITKKEREIIEMVEKEEKSKDKVSYISSSTVNLQPAKKDTRPFEPLGSERYNNPYFPEVSSHFVDDQDSEVLKVERELCQLEQEELERQRDNILFRKGRGRTRLANRHSLENIYDDSYSNYANISYRKSLPDLQHVPAEFRQSIGDVPSAYCEVGPQFQQPSNNLLTICHRKSMPELQYGYKNSAFVAPPPVDRRPIKPSIKPLRSVPNVKPRVLAPSMRTLSAIPKNRHSDSWITPKTTAEAKSYTQHWVIQEAELRRLTDQQKLAPPRQNKQSKPLPDSIIQTITQRVQNRNSLNERNQLRNEQLVNAESQHPIYANHPQAISHSVPFSPPGMEEGLKEGMLSVSGKKKCSYCSKELGRGAAMIIESLCLFYHMECFKCCVCHIQLGDGRIGTDVRVRNQKLHCHNCYSSDDGVKFSCV